MLRPILFAALFLAQTALAVAAPCSGPDPAIVNVRVQRVATVGYLNDYHLVGTVRNVGNADQSGDTLQSVDIFMNGARLDTRSIPPLRAGQSYTFTYLSQRARSAGIGTTTLAFRLDMHHTPAGQDCSTANDSYRLTF